MGTSIGKSARYKGQYRSFEEAREYVHSLCLTSANEWSKASNRPPDIPSNPNRVYKGKGWVSWGDWLGTGTIASYHRQYSSFDQAREFAHSLGLANLEAWRAWCKSGSRPIDIPSHPDQVYKGAGWVSWGDWLGTSIGKSAGYIREHRSFEEARKYARGLVLGSVREWYNWAAGAHRPAYIPVHPEQVYGDKGWCGWRDWLGLDDFELYARRAGRTIS